MTKLEKRMLVALVVLAVALVVMFVRLSSTRELAERAAFRASHAETRAMNLENRLSAFQAEVRTRLAALPR